MCGKFPISKGTVFWFKSRPEDKYEAEDDIEYCSSIGAWVVHVTYIGRFWLDMPKRRTMHIYYRSQLEEIETK